MWTYILLLVFIPINVFCVLSKGTDIENFGPYEFSIALKGYCKGPKTRDEVLNTFEFIKQPNGHFVGHSNMTFLLNTTRMVEIRMIVSVITNDGKKKNVLWRYKIDKPCQHFMYGVAIEKFLDSKNCVIKKGSYLFDTNVSEMASQFYGKSFFYGLYHLKSIVTSATGNVLCMLLELEFSKKTE